MQISADHKRFQPIFGHMPYAMQMIASMPLQTCKTYKAPVTHTTVCQNNGKHEQETLETIRLSVYVLDESLQTGKPFNKWKQRARVGIYLGQSPIHN